MSAFPSPSLVSEGQPIQQMGIETVRLPLKQIGLGDEVADHEIIVMDTQLIVRESSLRNNPL